MANPEVFKWFRIIAVIVVMVTLYTLIFMNFQLNLSGYVTPVVSNTFENIKAVYRGSSNKATTSFVQVTHRMAGTVADIYDGVKHNREPEFNPKYNNSRKDILWYNPPEWITIESENDVFKSQCVFDNCRMFTDKTDVQKYAAIIFSFTQQLSHMPPIPRHERNPDQAWIFFSSESPVHHSRIAYRHANWRNTMNWSMSYNMDADVFRPYGVLELKKEVEERDYSDIFRQKTKLVAYAVSHCGARSKRDEFVSELSSYGIQVDMFGRCKTNSFLNISDFERLISKDYKFYLSFENSFCKDYITEKFFRYFKLKVVLIVRGGFDYDKYLPNDTFINTARFQTAKELASYILTVGSSEEAYVTYLRNKDRYTAKSPLTQCSLCKKLNNLNENRKIYEDHVTYMHNNTCWYPTDVPKATSPLAIFASLILLTTSVSITVVIWNRNRLIFYVFYKNCLNICCNL